MNNRRTQNPTSASLPEGCCEFSKPDFVRIRAYLDEPRAFDWIVVYEAIAPKLLEFQNDRKRLVDWLYREASKPKFSGFDKNLSFYEEMRDDGTTIPMTDICPFSVMATFTLETIGSNRWPAAMALCELFNVQVRWPTSFIGLPTLMHINPRFYMRNADDRNEGDIDALWKVFVASAAYATDGSDKTRDDFIKAFDEATKVKQTHWNLTLGLYWSNPKCFPTLDKNSRVYIIDHLHIPLEERLCNGEEYVALSDTLQACFANSDCPFNDFQELARTARVEVAR